MTLLLQEARLHEAIGVWSSFEKEATRAKDSVWTSLFACACSEDYLGIKQQMQKLLIPTSCWSKTLKVF